MKYAYEGKPAAGAGQIVTGYKLDLVLERKADEVDTILNRKGRFILATNDLDTLTYPDARLLSEYKEQ